MWVTLKVNLRKARTCFQFSLWIQRGAVGGTKVRNRGTNAECTWEDDSVPVGGGGGGLKETGSGINHGCPFFMTAWKLHVSSLHFCVCRLLIITSSTPLCYLLSGLKCGAVMLLYLLKQIQPLTGFMNNVIKMTETVNSVGNRTAQI